MAGVGTAYPADYSDTYSGPEYTSQEGRTALAATMAGATAARPLGGISGVRPGTPNVASATPGTWTVTPFGGYIDLETSASNGGYFFSFLSNSTGTVSAAEGSARVDLLYVQIADTNTGDSTTVAPRVILDYQKGAAGAGVPTLTAARAFVIAQINVPATGGGSPTITWVAPYCAAAGGTVDFNTKAQLDLWTTAKPGQSAFVIADNSEYVWTGAAWVKASLVDDSGVAALTLSNSWVPYGSGGFAVPSRRKLNGRVELFGMMKSGTALTTVDTLPVGWRPLATRQFITPSNTGAAVFNILNTGVIQVAAYTTGGNNTNVSLDGIGFIAEA